jgi:prepilin-type N-terminal cleavage/methylation domain-containing protein
VREYKMLSRKDASGFTLVELMITVAIIGVLSATAITLFQGQQLRSKRAEGLTNVEALAKMAKAFFGENGSYPWVAGSWPAPVAAPAAIAWDAASSAQFGTIGFRAEGAVRYRYDLDATAAECPCASEGCFTAIAFSDLEGDGLQGGVAYFQRDRLGVECPSTIFGWNAPTNPQTGLPIHEASAAYPGGGGGGFAPDDY